MATQINQVRAKNYFSSVIKLARITELSSVLAYVKVEAHNIQNCSLLGQTFLDVRENKSLITFLLSLCQPFATRWNIMEKKPGQFEQVPSLHCSCLILLVTAPERWTGFFASFLMRKTCLTSWQWGEDASFSPWTWKYGYTEEIEF